MKLLIICAVFSVCVAVSLASPAKTQVRDEADSSSSAESRELKAFENSSSSSEEEKEEIKLQAIRVKDSSSDSSEERGEKNKIVKDALNEDTSVEHRELTEDDFIQTRLKRALNYETRLSVKDQDIIKYKKHLKLRSLGSTSENNFQNINDRNKRGADTSEENSSEENNKDKSQTSGVAIAKEPEKAPTDSDIQQIAIRRRRNSPSSDSSEENSSEEVKQETATNDVIKVGKPEIGASEAQQPVAEPDAAPAESDHKSEGARRKRNVKDLSEDDQPRRTHYENEVFILSKEKQTDNEDNTEDWNNNEPVVLDDKDFEAPESSAENKNSEEDYAQGCGGDRSDNSNENSNEKNETSNDNL